MDQRQACIILCEYAIPRPPFDDDLAAKSVKEWIDYFAGRCIKTDLSGDKAEPWGYDRDWGDGAFQRIVTELRKKTQQ